MQPPTSTNSCMRARKLSGGRERLLICELLVRNVEQEARGVILTVRRDMICGGRRLDTFIAGFSVHALCELILYS